MIDFTFVANDLPLNDTSASVSPMSRKCVFGVLTKSSGSLFISFVQEYEKIENEREVKGGTVVSQWELVKVRDTPFR